MAEVQNNKQILLKIEPKYKGLKYFFVTDANRDAINAALSYDIGFDPLKYCLIIYGSKFSGKTLLLKSLEEQKSAQFINSLDQIINSKADLFVLDDADSCNEEELLHIINNSNNRQKKLILTASINWQPSLSDLRSRINSIKNVEIKNPDDELIEYIISSYFSEKSINLPSDCLNYIKHRISRDYSEIRKITKEIDEFCLAEKRNLNLKSLSDYFRNYYNKSV